MKLSKIIKRFFSLILILVVVVIAAAIAIPYFFKDEIVERVKKDINNTVNATVDFKDVDLSLLRSFPDFNFQMQQFEIKGIDQFEGLTLASVEDLEFTLDLMSVIKTERPIEINEININKPIVNIKVLKDGTANYDISKASSSSSEGAGEYNFLIQLQKYGIANGTLTYDDQQSGMYLHLDKLNHNGKGDFTQDVYDLVTKTNVGNITTVFDGVKYINRAKGDLDITLNADMKNMKFTLKDNELILNALKLKANGFVHMKGDDILMDLKLDSPQNKFKNFLSLIPSAYTKDFDQVKANGDLKLDGFVKGTYNATKNQMPAFKLNLDIKNGDFQYPDLPMGISGINSKVLINSPSSDYDKMTIDIPQFSMKLGNNPFSGNFKLRTPISDPDIDTKLDGVINLEDFSKAFPLEGVQALNGMITTDMTAKTKMSYIENEEYERVDMNGAFRIENMNYKAEGLPPIKIIDANMMLNPKSVQLDNFEAKLGKSDVQARGTLDNIMALLSEDKTMKGDLKIRSDYFDLNEWMASSETETPTNTNTTATTETAAVFDRFDFDIEAQANKIIYDVYQLDRTNVKGSFTPSKLSLTSYSTNIGDTDISGKGNLTNVFNYVFEEEVLGGNLSVNSKFMNLNQFMTTDEISDKPKAQKIANEEEMAPVPVPENVDININANIDKLRYTNIDLKNVNGKMLIKDEQVKMRKVKANAFGGGIEMDGTYNTQDIDKPKFDLSYNFKSLKFQKAFDKLNTFQRLAPIGKFIQGTFNTNMKMSGELGKDLMPIMSTLTADGFLHTLDGIIQGLKPLEELGEKLNLNYFKSVKIKDSKNWFKVENGFVVIEDFDYKYKDIDMVIGGSHSFDQDMKYNVKAKLPRKLLEQNKVTAAANTGLNFLQKKANELGIPIKNSEFINVVANITGSIKNPKVKLNLLGGENGTSDVGNNIYKLTIFDGNT